MPSKPLNCHSLSSSSSSWAILYLAAPKGEGSKLCQKVGVADEGFRGFGQAARKIGPDHRARHIEEELWQAICRQVRDASEDNGESCRGQQRLNKVPSRTKNGLLVLCGKVVLYKHPSKVSVVP